MRDGDWSDFTPVAENDWSDFKPEAKDESVRSSADDWSDFTPEQPAFDEFDVQKQAALDKPTVPQLAPRQRTSVTLDQQNAALDAAKLPAPPDLNAAGGFKAASAQRNQQIVDTARGIRAGAAISAGAAPQTAHNMAAADLLSGNQDMPAVAQTSTNPNLGADLSTTGALKATPNMLVGGAAEALKLVGNAIQAGSPGDDPTALGARWAQDADTFLEQNPQFQTKAYKGVGSAVQTITRFVPTLGAMALAGPVAPDLIPLVFFASQDTETRKAVLAAGGSETDATMAGTVNGVISGVLFSRVPGLLSVADKTGAKNVLGDAFNTSFLPAIKEGATQMGKGAALLGVNNAAVAAVEQAYGVDGASPLEAGAEGVVTGLILPVPHLAMEAHRLVKWASSPSRDFAARFQQIAADPKADPMLRSAVVGIVSSRLMEAGAPEAARNFAVNGRNAIIARLPIDTSADSLRPAGAAVKGTVLGGVDHDQPVDISTGEQVDANPDAAMAAQDDAKAAAPAAPSQEMGVDEAALNAQFEQQNPKAAEVAPPAEPVPAPPVEAAPPEPEPKTVPPQAPPAEGAHDEAAPASTGKDEVPRAGGAGAAAAETPEEAGIRRSFTTRSAESGLNRVPEPGDVRVVQPTDAELPAAAAFKAAFNQDVGMIEERNGFSTGAAAFFDNNTGKIWLVRGKADVPVPLIWHELGHSIRSQNPALYAKILAVARPFMDMEKLSRFHAFQDAITPEERAIAADTVKHDTSLTDSERAQQLKDIAAVPHVDSAEARAKTLADMSKARKSKAGHDLGTKLEEEGVADFLGKHGSDPQFLTQLAEKNPGVFRELADHIVRYLNKLVGAFRQTLDSTSPWIKDIESTRDKMVELIHEVSLQRNPALAAQMAVERTKNEAKKATDEAEKAAAAQEPAKAPEVSAPAAPEKSARSPQNQAEARVTKAAEAPATQPAKEPAKKAAPPLAKEAAKEAATKPAQSELALKRAEKPVEERPEQKVRNAATLDDFAPGKVGSILKKKNWAILTAENPNGKTLPGPLNVARNERLKKDLDKMGVQYRDVIGRYGEPTDEHSFLVTGITSEQAKALGDQYGQDSVLTRNGLEHKDGSITPPEGDVTEHPTAPEDYYTRDPKTGSMFTVGLDFDKRTEPTKVSPEMEKLLTPEELTLLGQGRGRVARLIHAFTQMPKLSEFIAAAKAGAAARDWYARSLDAIRKTYGADHDRFLRLMAALSPQTSVKLNFYNAARVFEAWEKAGRTNDTKVLAKIFQNNLVTEKGGEEGKTAMKAWTNNAIRVLTATDPTTVRLSGPKVSSFMANLLGYYGEVTNDRHIADFAGIDQSLLGGLKDKAHGDLLFKSPGYIAVSAKVREAARELGWQPAETQAAIWSWWNALKKLTLDTKPNKSNDFKPANPEGKSALQLIREGALTNDRIAAEPHLGSYLHEDEFRSISEDRGRRADELVGREGRENGAGGQGTGEEGRGAAPGRTLETVARRIDQNLADAAAKDAATREATRAGKGDADESDLPVSDHGDENDIPFSREQTKTPKFKSWFGTGKDEAANKVREDVGIVDKDGQPERWFHGTARDIHSFAPKQANAIFLTKDTHFADGFAQMSHSWMANHPEQFLTPEQIDAAGKKVRRAIYQQPNETQEEKAWQIKDYKADPRYSDALSEHFPSADNIMPLYVRAKNPFDYENATQRNKLVNRVFMDEPNEKNPRGDTVVRIGDNVMRRPTLDTNIANGAWTNIESPQVQRALKALGHDAFTVMEGGRKNLAVWDPNSVKSAIGNNGHFSESTDISLMRDRPIGGHFNIDEQTAAENAKQKFVDRFERLGRIVKEIGEQGGTVTPQNNPDYAVKRMAGKVDHRAKEFARAEWEPLIKDMKEANVHPDNAVGLAYAIHAKDRNEAIRKIDPENDHGSGMTDEEAQSYIDGLRENGTYDTVKPFADRIFAITKETADLLEREGLLNAGERQAWLDKYGETYIPLRGEGETAHDINTLGQAPPGSKSPKAIMGSRGKIYERAKGRSTAAAIPDILSNIINDRVSAIHRAEQNTSGKVLLKFVLDNPDSNLWEVERNKVSKHIVKDAAGQEKVVTTETVDRDPATTVVVRNGGHEYVIKLNDSALAATLTGMNKEQLHTFMRGMGHVNRFFVKAWTEWNPVFVLRNTPRDIITSAVNSLAEHGVKRSGSMVGHVTPAALGLMKFHRGERSTDTDSWNYWAEQASKNGAFIGRTRTLGMDERSEQIENMWDDHLNAWKAPMKWGKAALHYVSDLNASTEAATRLATYRAAIEGGMPVEEAVAQARNIRVDFNQTGDWGPAMNATFLFYNPAMLETDRVIRAIKQNPGKMAGLVGAMVGIGASVAAMSSQWTDDNGEAYWDKPEYQHLKSRGLLFIKPDGSTFTMPLPYGYSAFFTLGMGFHDMAAGKKSKLDVAKEYATHAMVSLSPVGAAVGEMGPTAFLPTIAQAPTQLISNKDAFGSAIKPGSDSEPDSSRMRASTRGMPQEKLTTALNTATGGDENVPGAVSVSPEQLNFLINFVGGGVTQAIWNTMAVGYQSITGAGAQADVARLPFVREFTSPKFEHHKDTGTAQQRINDLKQIVSDYHAAEKAGDDAKVESLEDTYGVKMITEVGSAISEYQRDMKTVREQEKAIADLPAGARLLQQRELDRQKDEIVKTFNGLFLDANNGKSNLPTPRRWG